MDTKHYEAPALRVIFLQYLESFCASGGAPDYDPIDEFDWDNV